MDKEHHRASLKSQRENTAATFDSIVLCAGRDWEDNDIRFARFALVSTKIAAACGLDGLLRNRADASSSLAY
jgi:hypothetical protein